MREHEGIRPDGHWLLAKYKIFGNIFANIFIRFSASENKREYVLMATILLDLG